MGDDFGDNGVKMGSVIPRGNAMPLNKRDRFLDRLAPGSALWMPVFIVLYLYSLLTLYGHYSSGSFAFHDVTLTNDFLANTAYGRGFFYISEYGISHFKVHFTPTLLLLVPFYWVFDSQFFLIAAGVTSLYLSFLIFLSIGETLRKRFYPSLETTGSLGRYLPALFLFLIASNQYTKNVIMAANAWFLYFPAVGLVLLALLKGASYRVLLPLTLLTLGIRQDVGLYFSFQVGSLLFIAYGDKRLRHRIFVLCALGLLYTGGMAAWVLPWLGNFSHLDRGWSGYGSTWSKILITMIGSPIRLMKDVLHSAFLNLNTNFFWLPLGNPGVFLLNEAPGLLFYINSESPKKYLWYYNAGFLLPGIYLATWVGICEILRRVRRRFALGSGPWKLIRFALACMVPIALITFFHTNGLKYYPRWDWKQETNFRQVLNQLRTEHPKAKKIATDFHRIVFLPNRTEKYLLKSFSKADAVILSKQLAPAPGNFDSFSQALTTIQQTGEFKISAESERFVVFLKSGRETQ
jgi:uncharacterized membrane protein